MLDHPITVVLNVFDTLKNKGLKVYKFMSIQTQEEHIGHIKKSKCDIFQDRYFFSQAKHGCTHIFPKTEKPNVNRGIYIFLCNFLIMHTLLK